MRARISGLSGMSDITIKRFTDAGRFRDMQASWQALLEQSSANPLFLGWQWQYSWWETWGDELGLELCLLQAWQGDRLVGIAPLYLHTVPLLRLLPVRRLQFIGNAWKFRDTVRTEYLEFITPEDCAGDVCAAFAAYIENSLEWDDFVVCDLLNSTETWRQLAARQARSAWTMLERSRDYGIVVDTQGKFSDYLDGLGRHTRRKLYNQRALLEWMGAISFSRASTDNHNEHLATLNQFHRERWGKDCFSGHSLDFHRRFIARLPSHDVLDMNSILLDGRPVSTIYNIRLGGCLYNLQSGFDERLNDKLSPGTLHIGYSIESAFTNPGVTGFDLLAGKGKHEFYKSRFKGSLVQFRTIQLVRNRLLRVVYALYYLLRTSFVPRVQQDQR